uniref:Uncharacterized protein n=1 Tax=Arundo donax TaxID=35708 RepID=A0A0A8ZRV7_ARUDO
MRKCSDHTRFLKPRWQTGNVSDEVNLSVLVVLRHSIYSVLCVSHLFLDFEIL